MTAPAPAAPSLTERLGWRGPPGRARSSAARTGARSARNHDGARAGCAVADRAPRAASVARRARSSAARTGARSARNHDGARAGCAVADRAPRAAGAARARAVVRCADGRRVARWQRSARAAERGGAPALGGVRLPREAAVTWGTVGARRYAGDL